MESIFAEGAKIINIYIDNYCKYIQGYINNKETTPPPTSLVDGVQEITKNTINYQIGLLASLRSTVEKKNKDYFETIQTLEQLSKTATSEEAKCKNRYEDAYKIQIDQRKIRRECAYGINSNAIQAAQKEAKKSQVMQECSIAILTIVKKRSIVKTQVQTLLNANLITEIQELELDLDPIAILIHKKLVEDVKKSIESSLTQKKQNTTQLKPLYDSFIECADKLINEAENQIKIEEYKGILAIVYADIGNREKNEGEHGFSTKEGNT